MNKDKNQLMSLVQELCFLAGAIAGVGVTAGPDTGTITGSMTAVPNGLAHVAVDVTVDVTVGMTVQLLHTAVGVMQCDILGVTHCEVDGDVYVHILQLADDAVLQITGDDVLHIVVGDMQWDVLGVTHCEVDGDVQVIVLHTTDDVLQIIGDDAHDTLHLTIDELAGVELGTDCEYTLNPDMSVSVKV